MTSLSDAHTAVTSLKGKRVLVTGGSKGIGRAIAVLLASEGARVHICGRDEEPLQDALKRINEVGEGNGIAIDLAERGAPARYVDEAVKWLGGLDIAVINAAIAAEGLSDTAPDDLDYVVATDFAAYYAAAHAAVRHITEGDVILIGSTSAHSLSPSSTVYAGIKAGIAGFAEALTKEVGAKGIRVSLIEPGMTGSDMQSPDIPPDQQAKLINEDKMLRAEDIAVAAHFMLTQPRRTVVMQMAVVPRLQEA